jgi:SAM-dependent methyltransferase
VNNSVDQRFGSHNISEGQTRQGREGSPFDAYASSYEKALAQGLSITGESSTFFARERVVWLTRRLKETAERPRQILDFGCGTGAAAPYFFQYLSVEFVIGIDPSASSLAVAREDNSGATARFLLPEAYHPNGQVDLAFTNGVFHHIRPSERKRAAHYLFRTLRPGGILAFWENNPWNPGTRYVMWRIPFDRDAVPVWPSQARALLQTTGFEILHTDFLFLFPRILRRLRWIEPHLAQWPLGAQYEILCRKPSTAT